MFYYTIVKVGQTSSFPCCLPPMHGVFFSLSFFTSCSVSCNVARFCCRSFFLLCRSGLRRFFIIALPLHAKHLRVIVEWRMFVMCACMNQNGHHQSTASSEIRCWIMLYLQYEIKVWRRIKSRKLNLKN